MALSRRSRPADTWRVALARAVGTRPALRLLAPPALSPLLAAAASRAAASTWADVLAAAILSRAAICLVAFLALGLLPPQQLPDAVGLPPAGSRVLDAAWGWDAAWYGAIARLGYSTEPPLDPTAAFWPLFPLTLGLLARLLGDGSLYMLGVAVPLCAYVLALYYLHRLVEEGWGRQAARLTVLLVSVFPSSFYLSVAYPTAPALLFSVAVFWHARRAEWWRAGAFGLLAALTDVPGVLLALPLGCEYLRRHGLGRAALLRPAALALALPLLGAALFMAYLQLALGDPLAFMRASELWEHRFSPAPLTVLDALARVLSAPFATPLVALNLTVALGFAAAGAWWLGRGEVAFGAWMLAVLGLYLSYPPAEPLDGVVRYALPLFPGFLALALAIRRSWWLQQAALALCLAALGLLTALFVTDHWVA